MENNEERFVKEKSAEETMKEAMEYLYETRFNFASFIDKFEKSLIKLGLFKKEKQ